ncbi:MAG: hypothetical protein M1370_03125 [Bacteroidetes bacterium]|nr:hypothetical protein [Bacteroidota bacterium]
MRRFLLAIVAVAALSMAGTTLALANGGPHGGYQSTDATTKMNSEDACAGCHRAHTGYSSLLKISSEYGLCTSCHASAGAATTDVVDGTLSGGGNLNGGLFNVATTGATSIHTVNTGVTTVPDYNATDTMGSGTGTLTRALNCTSCHDPHGNANYRMLLGGLDGKATVSVTSNETVASYTATNWATGTTQFCASCHNLDKVSSATGDSSGVHRHFVDVQLSTYGGSQGPLTTILPMQNSTPGTVSNAVVVCMTCHKPHGTSVTNLGTNNYSAGVTIANVSIDTTGNPTYLLRMNNRGVCEDCHKK